MAVGGIGIFISVYLVLMDMVYVRENIVINTVLKGVYLCLSVAEYFIIFVDVDRENRRQRKTALCFCLLKTGYITAYCAASITIPNYGNNNKQ